MPPKVGKRVNIAKKPPTAEKSVPVVTTKSVKEIFKDYQDTAHFGQLLGDDQKKKKSDESVAEEKLQRIKRIVNATKEGVKEICTFEFFNFSNPMNFDNQGAESDIYLIAFNPRNVERVTLFSGLLPAKKEVDKRVVYFPIPKKFNDARSVYLVAKVEAQSIVSTGRRRASANSPMLKETYWGARCIMRPGKDGSPEVTYCNSSIPMVTVDNPDITPGVSYKKLPFLSSTHSTNTGQHNKTSDSPDRKASDLKLIGCWFDSESNVATLEATTKHLLVSSSVPRIDFELTDQHCEEDWDVIRELAMEVQEKLKIEDEDKITTFIAEDHVPSPEKENSSPVRKTVHTLIRLPFLRCPMTFANFTQPDVYLMHLNAGFSQLHFQFKNEHTVLVSLSTDADKNSEEGSEKREPFSFGVGALPIDRLPFNHPVEEDVNLSVNLSKSVWRHIPHGNWKNKMMYRNVVMRPDGTKEAKEFMVMANEFLMREGWEKVSPVGVRKSVMRFLRESRRVLIEKKFDLFALSMAAKMKEFNILTAADYAEIFDSYADPSDLDEEEQEEKQMDMVPKEEEVVVKEEEVEAMEE